MQIVISDTSDIQVVSSSNYPYLKESNYYGVLQQEKNPKELTIKLRQRALPKEEWVIFENHHEGTVTKEEYETVQMLLMKDTRIAPGETDFICLVGYYPVETVEEFDPAN